MFMLFNIYNAPTYTGAYLGLCPRKLFWCPGKNNVEAIVKQQLIACDCKLQLAYLIAPSSPSPTLALPQP